MKKQTKLWLIAACTLFLVGSILFIGGMTALKWNFKKLSTVTYETRVYTLSDNFQKMVRLHRLQLRHPEDHHLPSSKLLRHPFDPNEHGRCEVAAGFQL